MKHTAFDRCPICGGKMMYAGDETQELDSKPTHHIYNCKICGYPKYKRFRR